MIGVYGVRTTGGVTLWGSRISEFALEAGKEWPWPKDRTHGETRIAVSWPDEEDGSMGCLAFGVMAPDNRMWVPIVERFARVGTRLMPEIGEGLGYMLCQVWAFGLRHVYVECGNIERAQIWTELLGKDWSMKGLTFNYEAVQDIRQCLEVLREMTPMIALSRETATETRMSNASGKLSTVTVALAMLAAGYKLVPAVKSVQDEVRRQG